MIEEDVYETAHLEILPPNQRAGVQDLSSQDEDGIWRITCLNTNNTILLYNNPEHWNLKLKDQFLQNVHTSSLRCSTYGIRAIMAITGLKTLNLIANGRKRPMPASINKHFPNDQPIIQHKQITNTFHSFSQAQQWLTLHCLSFFMLKLKDNGLYVNK